MSRARSTFAARSRRALGTISAAVGLLVVFVVSLIDGVLLNLDAAVTRRLAVRELNGILGAQFKGKITIERLAHLSMFGVRGVDATVTSPDGRRLLSATGIAGRISPLRIVKSVLSWRGDIQIDVTRLSAGSIDVDVETDADGSLKLVHAFDPAKPSPPSPPGSRGTAIALENIVVSSVWAHGTVAGVPPLDVDVFEVKGAFLSTSTVTRLDLGHLRLLAHGLPRSIRADAEVEAHVAMPSSSGASMAVKAHLAAEIGEIPLTAGIAMDGDAVDGFLDVPVTTGGRVQSSIEGVPIYESVSAHAEAHGDLANLAVALDARLGKGTVSVDGLVHAKGPHGGKVTVKADHLDARTFSKEGPATDLGVRVDARAETRPDGLLIADASVDLPEGMAAGQVVPHVALTLSATQRPSKGGSPRAGSAHLEGMISEPGAKAALTADGTSLDGTSRVTFGVKADVPRLSEVRRLGNLGSGSVDFTLSGHAEVRNEVSFEAELDAHGARLDRPGVHLDSVHVAATAHGTTANPQIEAHVVAAGVAASGYRFSRAQVWAGGTRQKGRVTVSASGDRSDLTLNGDVSLAPVLLVNQLSLRLRRERASLAVGVDALRVEGNTIDASGIAITGAGEPLRARFHAAPGLVSLTASSAGLDLGKLAALAGRENGPGGRLSLNVDLEAQRAHARGKLSLDLTNGEWSTVHGADVSIGLAIDDRRLTGKLHAGLGAVGSLDVSDVDVHVGGLGPLDAAAWKNTWGRMTVAANVDVARAAALVPAGMLHMADIAGRITLSGDVARDSLADTTPGVHLSLATFGLAATGESTPPVRPPGGPLMVGPPTWQLRGVDARVDLIIDDADSAGELGIRFVDAQGALAGLDVKTAPLPFTEILRGDGDLVALLERLPMSLLLDVPARELSSLPVMIRPDGVSGGLAATLSMKGTLLAPVVDLSVTTRRMIVAATPDTPMNGAVKAHYDGKNARVNVSVTTRGTSLLSADGDLHVPAKDIVLAKGLPAQWRAAVAAKLARFPLNAIGALRDNQVKGVVSGDFSVTGLHENARASVSLALDELRIGKEAFSSASVGATIDDKGFQAKARFEQTNGFLEAAASMGMKWGNALVPVSDGKGLRATLRAKHFSAGAIAPFASRALSELSGSIDADATVVLDSRQKPRMTGAVTFTDGALQAPALGEEFHAIKAKITLNEDGLVRLEGVEARALSGRLRASGSAHLDGTELVAADLAIDISKKDAIPLDVQGTNLGSVYGKVTVSATGAADGKALKVDVAVPHFHVDLPSGSVPRAPQALGEAPGVHMGVYRNPDRFLVLPLDAAPVKLVAERNTKVAQIPAGVVGAPSHMEAPAANGEPAVENRPPGMEVDATVHLGDVQILRGQQLAVNLGGDLSAKTAATTTVRGEIHLKSGKLDVQGKEFAIEKGTVSFVGNDPSNPEANITAAWTAPDGTKVLAEYVGRVKTGKVTLRSEPARPRNEIVQLILFGTADGSEATPYASKSPSTGTQAGTAVGGLATEGISKGLDQLTGMNVTAKVDTSDAANPRADVELQLAKDISLQLAYVIVQPPPGDNPDLIYVTVDWRFVRNWSLETTVGDAGSTFANLVWQYRY